MRPLCTNQCRPPPFVPNVRRRHFWPSPPKTPTVRSYDVHQQTPRLAPGARLPAMSNDLSNVDVAVVGGGIIGCAVALAARRRGLSVAVLERGRICGEASSAAGGLICAQYDADHDTPLVRLRIDGRDAFPEFALLLEELTGLSVGYSAGPTLGLARTDEQRTQLLARVAWQRKAGLDAEFLEPDEARRREPLLPPDLTAAACYPDGQVDTQRWAPIIHRALLAAGVHVHEGTDVTAVAAGPNPCVVYPSDAAADLKRVDRGGGRMIK
ncbi:MAG: FAD-dependent oxidoreductase [Chloroflexi bacterium]|nr:FAD-dependent oxidoreductase [Chloroflexota bacterium]